LAKAGAWPAGASAKAGFAAKSLSAATICAEIALAPVGARLFGRISIAGLVLNFAAIPLMSVIQVAGLLAVGLSTVSAEVASIPGWIAHVSTVALLGSASLVDVFPWTVVEVAAPAAWVIALWYLGWGILYFLWRRLAARAIGFASIAFSACAMVWSPPSARAALLPAPLSGWSRVVFIDVGQGDATLIQPSLGAPLLIDAGGVPGSSFDLGRRVTMPALWGLGIRDLGALAVTHGDPDHIGGAGAMLRALRTLEVWEGIPVSRHQPLRDLRSLAVRRGSRWRELRSGDAMAWGAARLRVLNPPPPDWERHKVRNDDSIVLEVRIGRVAIILPGDISQAVEPDVAAGLTHAPGDVTIVKAPHHGSAGSSSDAFIAATRPAAVIFSAGRRNPFGHPAAATLARYATAGARIFRTDEDGEVVLDTDGERVVVWTWGGRREEIGQGPSPKPH
jgi:competence protein ComEC